LLIDLEYLLWLNIDMAVRLAASTVTDETPTFPRKRIAWLALGTFALGTESLVIGGVLPDIARSFAVTESRAALLVTAYAVTYAVAAPLTSLVASRFAPKAWLVSALVIFAVANLGASAAPSFAALLIARVAAGIVASSYTPNASGAATSLAAPAERGRALSLVYLGMSVATVVGVPIGTLLSSFSNWRATFVFVSVLSIAAAVGVGVFMPSIPRREPIDLCSWAATFADRRIQKIVTVTSIASVAQFTVFTLFAVLVRDLTGAKNLVAIALLLFGVTAIVGNSLGGTFADRKGPQFTSSRAIGAMAVGFVVIAIATQLPTGVTAGVVGLIGMLVWGVAGWAFLAPLQLRLTQVAGSQTPLALSVNSTSLYIGIAIGGAVAGLALSLGGPALVAIVGAAIAVVAAKLATRI
jgi:MFS transporter, DHA1 family, inner membrane transport protein